jgi:hypothetical protein
VTADGGDTMAAAPVPGPGLTSGGRTTDGGMTPPPSGGQADDFYAHESFDEDRFWAARRSTGLGGALGTIGRDVEPGAGGLGNSDPNARRLVDEPGGLGNADPGTRGGTMR